MTKKRVLINAVNDIFCAKCQTETKHGILNRTVAICIVCDNYITVELQNPECLIQKQNYDKTNDTN